MLLEIKIALSNGIQHIKDAGQRELIVRKFHEDALLGGHCGRNRLYSKLRSKYFWKGMSKDVARIVKTCEKCQLNKTQTHTKKRMQRTATPQKAFDCVIMDYCFFVKKSGNLSKKS